ncbi:TPA: hypothetical protein ENG04_07145, partial [Candidatus Poribacteria bacterium]|nr:hypothetical protein [Candidatus Poribacteria bacterium]HEX29842.1 hypothetical protein [Candidatus Poribacteria bacterium]
MSLRHQRTLLSVLLTLLVGLPVYAALTVYHHNTLIRYGGEVVSKRPYELDWAGRYQDDHPPLVDFENLEGWHVKVKDAVAEFERSDEQQIWDSFVGKLTYRAVGADPEVIILPPHPIEIHRPFDAVTVWIYGNNWAWAPDPTTPQVNVIALFEDAEGKPFEVYMTRVRWKEWFL